MQVLSRLKMYWIHTLSPSFHVLGFGLWSLSHLLLLTTFYAKPWLPILNSCLDTEGPRVSGPRLPYHLNPSCSWSHHTSILLCVPSLSLESSLHIKFFSYFLCPSDLPCFRGPINEGVFGIMATPSSVSTVFGVTITYLEILPTALDHLPFNISVLFSVLFCPQQECSRIS